MFSQHIMMESPGFEEVNIVQDTRNRFRLENLKKENLIPQLKT